MLSDRMKALFRSDPARAIEVEIREFVRTSPLNRMPATREHVIFDEPLVAFADGDDPLYTSYKDIIDPSHLTPREALALALGRTPGELPRRLAVVSWVLPVGEAARSANRRETKVPSRLWSHQRYYGGLFNEALRRHVVAVLTELGALAVAPQLAPFFRTAYSRRVGIFSNWSERHSAYVAGLGTFSLTDGFITPRGIAHRCGNVVTDLPLPASPRPYAGHLDNCAFYLDGSCRACIARCPAGAITERGHDKSVCLQYLREIGSLPVPEPYDDATSVFGCGLCQTKVPCEYRIPEQVQKRRQG